MNTLPKTLVLMLAMGAATAQADVYVGASAGHTWLDGSCVSGSTCEDGDEFTYSLIGGFQLHNNLALEFNFQDLGEYQSDALNGDVLVYSLAPKVSHYLTENLAMYGKIGGAFVDFDDGDNYTYLGAVGMDYQVSNHVDVRLEYQHLTDISYSVSKMSSDTVSLGMIYRFGGSQEESTSRVEEPEVMVEDKQVAVPLPAPVPEPKVETRVYEERKVGTGYFDTESSQLTFEDQEQLVDLTRFMNEHPQSKVQIVGHTDATGSESFNMEMSQERAQSVGTYLIARGIDGQRISVIAKGESEPVATNATPEGRAQNRRVEIVVPRFEYQAPVE